MKLAKPSSLTSPAALAAATAAGAAVTALWVRSRARRAEREHPPRGRFVEVDGTRLHYVERGVGPTVVLLHGNAVSLADFEASRVLASLARNHRVVAFDRPGFGHSSRPRDRRWTPKAQADVLHAACVQLGLVRPVLVGHSMGTVVALAWALDYPEAVAGLTLLGGYYYPTVRLDALAAAPATLPVLGDVMRHTVTALSARALLGTSVKAMFSPVDVPENFFPTVSREMMLRPSQLRADLEDGTFMVAAAKANAARYAGLKMPVSILAGAADKVVDPEAHAVRFHDDLADSELHVVPAVGHMVHYAAVDAVTAAVARMARGASPEVATSFDAEPALDHAA